MTDDHIEIILLSMWQFDKFINSFIGESDHETIIGGVGNGGGVALDGSGTGR
jgi:hypothetical protein